MNCKHCGAALPENAAFCPVCHRSQQEATPVAPPRPRKKWILPLCLILVLAAGICAAVLTRPEPAAEPEEASAGLPNLASISNKEGIGSATYDVGYDHFVVYLNCNGIGEADKTVSVRTYSGYESKVPCMLYAEKNGEPAGDEFLSLVESMLVEIINTEGEPMTVTQPAPSAEYPRAAMVSDIFAGETAGSGTLQWTCLMKDGIKVIIRQNLIAEMTPKFRYFADEHPMHTDEELDALMEKILSETPENAMIQLFLPAVTYEKPHTFPDRCYQVLGAIESEEMTVFKDTVTFTSEKNEVVDIQNAVLQGGGSGTALKTDVAASLLFCTVQNWEVGVETEGRGSVYVEDCTFTDNGTALRWNSEELYSVNSGYRRTVFAGNTVAIDLQQLPGKLPLTFNTCTFTDNGTDIQNPIGYPVDLTGAVTE